MTHCFRLTVILQLVYSLASVAATSIGRCTTLQPTESALFNTTCSDVVDYQYFLPASASTVYLDQIARSKLSNVELSFLPTKCQIALKKAVCASVYMKCPPNFSETNLGSYNFGIFSDVRKLFPLPFQRPCISVCENANGDCLGLLNLKNRAVNCFARTDYSYGVFGLLNNVTSYPFPYTYDITNGANCNNIPATVQIASTAEPYIFAASNGVCAGITTSLFVPPGNSISNDIAPMQAPYVVQSVIESALAVKMRALPAWLSPACHLSLRKFFCGSYMLSPQPQRFGDVLIANNFTAPVIMGIKAALGSYGVNVAAYLQETFYLPSYPSKQVCYDYRSACGAFINVSAVAALVPLCNSVANGVMKYPASDQTIASLPLSPTLIIKYQTSPNAMSDASDGDYKTVCPSGYVVPDTPNSGRNVYVPGSGCAVACRIPLITASQILIANSIVVIGPAVSVAVLFLLFISWMLWKVKDPLVALFATSAGANSVWFVVIAIAKKSSSNPDSIFCLNNAIQLRQSDGPSLCVVQGVISHYTTLVCAFTFFFMGLNFMLRVRGHQKSYLRWAIGISVLCPVVFVIVTGAYAQYGYDGLHPYCMYQYDARLILQIGFFYIPLLVTITIGDILFSIAGVEYILKCSKYACTAQTTSPMNEKSTPEWSAPQNIKRTTLFVSAYVVFWLSMFIYRLGEMIIHNKLVRSFQEWVVCTFTNFDPSNSDSWMAVCGNRPKLSLPFSFIAWATLWLTCHSLLVVGVYLPSVWADRFSFQLTSSKKVGVLNSSENAEIVAIPHNTNSAAGVMYSSNVKDAFEKA